MTFSYYEKMPENWLELPLSQVAYFERGITFPASAKESLPSVDNISCIRTANVQERLEIDDLIYVNRCYLKPNKLLQDNDIIMSSANSKELVGKSCIAKGIDTEMTFGGFVLVIRSIGITPKYLHLCLRDLFYKGAFIQESTQTTNIANINTDTLSTMRIPVPPISEQHKIVSIVEKAFTTLKIIEKSLS